MLKGAMSEIEDVCKRYNCGGFVSLVSKTHGEFRYIMPEWSMARLVKDGRAIHFKARKFDHEAVEQTVHLVMSIQDTCGVAFLAMEELIKMLKLHMTINHRPLAGFEPHLSPEGE